MQHPVLDHGYVELVDSMGDDLTVVNAARVSFKKRSEWIYESVLKEDPFSPQSFYPERTGKRDLPNTDKKLIAFLAAHNHWSPFSHPQLMFEVRAPIMVKNQWIKHRIGMSYGDEDEIAYDNTGWNEMSMRYVEPEDFYVPTVWRSAPDNKKQGSGPDLTGPEFSPEAHTHLLERLTQESFHAYKEALEAGVAPEQARVFLHGFAVYTSFYWTTSLFGACRAINLRTKEDAQYEIREYFKVVETVVREVFPYSAEALLHAI